MAETGTQPSPYSGPDAKPPIFREKFTGKFVQIACSTGVDHDLYALDDRGQVWTFKFGRSVWTMMPTARIA